MTSGETTDQFRGICGMYLKLLQNVPRSKQPFKMQPQIETKTSLEVLNLICPPQEPTSVGHCHYKK